MTNYNTLTGKALVAYWNALPGAKPVTKFTTNAIGHKRIAAYLKANPSAVSSVKRETTASRIIAFCATPQTITAIMAHVDWLRHSVRGFFSNLSKTRTVERYDVDGQHAYRVV